MTFRTHLVPLFRDLRISSDDDQNYVYVELDVAALTHLLAYAEVIDVHALTTASTNGAMAWNIELISGFNRNHEQAAVPLSPTDFGAALGNVKVAYTTTASFLLNSRVRLRYKRGAGQSGTKTALVSCVLAVRTVGS